MTQGDVIIGPDEWWATYPGASHYQFSAAGRARSIDRVLHGRKYEGKILAQSATGRPPGKPPEERYQKTNIRMDGQTEPTTVMIHVGMMLSRTRGGRRPVRDGVVLEACHNDGNGAHNWFANLRWDTPESNRVDRYGEHVRKVATDIGEIPQIAKSSRFTQRVMARLSRRFATKRDESLSSHDSAA